MRLSVENLPSNGRTVQFTAAEGWARDAAAAVLEATPTSVTGSIELGPPEPRGRVTATVRASASAQRECDRCGEPTILSIETDVVLVYIPAAVQPAAPAAPTGRPARVEGRPNTPAATDDDEDDEGDGLSDDDLEIGWYTGGELDLGDVLREGLALVLPSRIVCADAPACDVRTEQLLRRASSGPPEPTGGFSVLRGLDLSGRGPKKSN